MEIGRNIGVQQTDKYLVTEDGNFVAWPLATPPHESMTGRLFR